jgi:hypothetical protein
MELTFQVGATRAVEDEGVEQGLNGINVRFAACIAGLESFMTINHRHDLEEEISANVLASTSDDVELDRIENIGAGLDGNNKLTNSIRIKRKLQQIRQTHAKVSGDLRWPLRSIDQRALKCTRSLTVTIYSEDTEGRELRHGLEALVTLEGMRNR